MKQAHVNPISHVLGLVAVIALSATIPAVAHSLDQGWPVLSSDRQFVTSLLQEARAQLAYARLARTRVSGRVAIAAVNDETTEWTSLTSRLLPITHLVGAPIRDDLSVTQQATLDRLSQTPATQFDDAYLNVARRGESVALDRIESENSTSFNPPLLRFVDYAQRAVERYEAMAPFAATTSNVE